MSQDSCVLTADEYAQVLEAQRTNTRQQTLKSMRLLFGVGRGQPKRCAAMGFLEHASEQGLSLAIAVSFAQAHYGQDFTVDLSVFVLSGDVSQASISPSSQSQRSPSPSALASDERSPIFLPGPSTPCDSPVASGDTDVSAEADCVEVERMWR